MPLLAREISYKKIRNYQNVALVSIKAVIDREIRQSFKVPSSIYIFVSYMSILDYKNFVKIFF
jgi:hypothetical protein